MEASFSQYDFTDSVARIDEILEGADASYKVHDGIPARTSLTFDNGFYVDVTVLFVDIRGSKELSKNHTRPVLAKIYRAYISEIVAVMKTCVTVSEIYIEGDGVWAVFNTTLKTQVDEVFEIAGQISSLVSILNIKLSKKNYTAIKIGIGVDFGTALYIKAGYKGSGINEVVWLGDVVGHASLLCSYANKTWSDAPLMVSHATYNNMNNEEYKGFLTFNPLRDCYQGTIHNSLMNEWVKENRK